MGSTTIKNAAPMTIVRGIQDKSTREQLVEAEAVPTHLAKVYVYAQKGPTTPQLVVGASRTNIFGDDTFDIRKSYATHQTVLSNLLNAQGNAQMIERVLPADVGPRANMCLWLDVLPTDVPQYQRGADGAVVLDGVTGQPVPVVGGTTLPGFKVKWVVTSVTALADESKFGGLVTTPGDQTTGGQTPVQSTRYPILQFWASSAGAVFNNSGLRLWAPTELSTNPVNTKALSAMSAYPFRLSVIKRATASESPRAVETQDGEQFIEFTVKPDTLNPLTDANFSLADIFLAKYTNTENNGFPINFGEFGGVKVYANHIASLVAQFYAAEFPNAGAFSDFTGAAGEEWLFNILSGQSSKGVPYFTYLVDTTAVDAVRLSETTNLYAKGGADGTMNETLFAGLVSTAVSEYANPNSRLQDTAVNVESVIYDTGFPLSTKRALCKFIAERKDTAVILSTYDVNGPEMTAAEESSVAVALKTYLQAYPESDYFGTATVRGAIIGRYGRLIGNQYRKKLPLTLEVAVKLARMMGAADGKWKADRVFDRAPNNEVTMFDQVNATFTPAAVRNKDWDLGLNWVQSFSRNSLFFPALKTAYDDDTSVLTSIFTMFACVELQKVGERVWREYSGSVRLTPAQLVERVNAAVEAKTLGRFADMYRVVPAAFMTAADEARGYSWTLPIKLYANNMKTVMTLDIQAYRMTDLVA